MSTGTKLAATLLLACTALAAPALATSPCDAPLGVWGPFAALPHATAALESGQALRIVAIGSSSTEGAGASSPAHSYPAQLAGILADRFQGVSIEVLNKGIGGETVAKNLARFNTDVEELKPDLVIWQVGTNDAFQGKGTDEVRRGLVEGIGRIAALGADIVLMDAQYFPRRPDTEALRAGRALVRDVAASSGVGFLPRFALMRHWIEEGQFTADTLLVNDGIHMSDASYHCLAVRVADLLPATPVPGTESVAAAVTDERAPPSRTLLPGN